MGHFHWFKVAYASKNIVFDVFETFPKSTYRNHYTISDSQGLLNLSIPLCGRSSKHKTHQIKINYSEQWIEQHLKSLKAAYQNSPYYIHFIDDLKIIFESKPEFLWELNFSIFNWVNQLLSLKINAQISNDFPPAHLNKDFRFGKPFNKNAQQIDTPEYFQQFSDRLGYQHNLSIVDALFNLGLETRLYLKL